MRNIGNKYTIFQTSVKEAEFLHICDSVQGGTLHCYLVLAWLHLI